MDRVRQFGCNLGLTIRNGRIKRMDEDSRGDESEQYYKQFMPEKVFVCLTSSVD